jgi:SPP1 family predicted phage head-tail adaptor
MRDAVITLISNSYTVDDYGVRRPVSTSREVFCRIGSITRSEFYAAGRNGLNPDFMFTVFSADYDGEAVCEYDGKRYSIYRTYYSGTGDYTELYVQREGGTNGTAQGNSG